MKSSRGLGPLLYFGLLLVKTTTAGAQDVPGPVRGEIREQTSASPLPGAVLRWLADAPAATDNFPTAAADYLEFHAKAHAAKT